MESANSGVNQPESEVPEAPISESAQLTQSQPASPAPAPVLRQRHNHSNSRRRNKIRSDPFVALLAKAQAKIQSNKQKKLELLMQAVSKNGKIDNREAQKVLRISDKTAERYLNKLVAQGRLKRSGAGRDVVYTL